MPDGADAQQATAGDNGSITQIGGDNLGVISHNTYILPPAQKPSIRKAQTADPTTERLDGRENLKTLLGKLEVYPVVQIHGLPGVGKTLLAYHAARELRDKYELGIPTIEVLDLCERLNTNHLLEDAFNELCRRILGEFFDTVEVGTDVAKSVREILDSEKCLLVLDNLETVELLELVIQRLKPRHLLVTSRIQANLAEDLKMHLHELDRADSISLYKRDSSREDGYAELDVICSILGDLPLAITLVAKSAAYLQQSAEIVLQKLREIPNLLDAVKYLNIPNKSYSARVAFEYSFGFLSGEAKKVFLIFGALKFENILFPNIQCIVNQPDWKTHEELKTLELSSLLRDTDDSYYMHPLLREFSKEKFNSPEFSNFKQHFGVRNNKLLNEFSIMVQASGNLHTISLNEMNFLDTFYDQITQWILKFPDPVSFEILIFLCTYSLDYGNTMNGVSFLEDFAELCEKKPNLFMRLIVLNNLPLLLSRSGNNERAIEVAEKSLRLARLLKNKEVESNAYGTLGSAYFLMQDYDNSRKYHEMHKEKAIELEDERGKANAIASIAGIYDKLGQFRVSMEEYEVALKIFIEMNDLRGISTTYGNIANVYDKLGNFEKSIENYIESIKTSPEKHGLQLSLYNLGFSFHENKQYLPALACWLISLKLAVQVRLPAIDTLLVKIAFIPDLENLYENIQQNGLTSLTRELGFEDRVFSFLSTESFKSSLFARVQEVKDVADVE
jgi:tetratricopeptide (TPR) repeat protein